MPTLFDKIEDARSLAQIAVVTALAHRLDAKVATASGPAGLSVSVTHATPVSRLPA